MPEIGGTRKSSAILGATITAVELPTAFPYFAAIAAIVGSGLDPARQVFLLVLFNVCFILPLVGIWATLTFAGDRADRMLAIGRDFLERHWPISARDPDACRRHVRDRTRSHRSDGARPRACRRVLQTTPANVPPSSLSASQLRVPSALVAYPPHVAKVELELQRLAQIQEVMEAKLPEIVGGMLESLDTAISQLEEAIRSEDLERAAQGCACWPKRCPDDRR